MELHDTLQNFQVKQISSLESLTYEFGKLAEVFLHGEYLLVSTDYRTYIRTVECYLHDEQDTPKVIKAP